MWLINQHADSGTTMLETATVLVGTATALRVTIVPPQRLREFPQRLGRAAQAFRNGGTPPLEPP
ncbi:hypothetical protein [Nocardia amikacinitolerans]|uniref:hypothetical protein n=1 Tax=Nocardia amikacinitolerans TaxID=756689 RepID=UPI000BE4854E|nr:hypothetical protein [Nocardia amikacinitolerans]